MTKERSEAEIVFDQHREIYSDKLRELEKLERQLLNTQSKKSQLEEEHEALSQQSRNNNHDEKQKEAFARKARTTFANKVDQEAKITDLKRQIEALQEEVGKARIPLTEAQSNLEAQRHSLITQREKRAMKNDDRRMLIDEKRLEIEERKQSHAEQQGVDNAVQAERIRAETEQRRLEFEAKQLLFEKQSQEKLQKNQLDHARETQLLEQSHALSVLRTESFIEQKRIKTESSIVENRITHETSERIRENLAKTATDMRKRTHETTMTAKELIIRHLLEKDMLEFKAELFKNEKNIEIEEILEMIKVAEGKQ